MHRSSVASTILATLLVLMAFPISHSFSDYSSLEEPRNDIFSSLENDTGDVIEYVNKTNAKKKKKFYFWELLDKNE